MNKIIDNLILVTKDGSSVKIGFLDVGLIKKSNEYEKHEHFSGKIILDKEKTPNSLYKLLIEQEKLVNNGLFHTVDQIVKEINKFDIFIETSNIKIYDLYVENEKGDFKISKQPLA